MYAYPIIMVLSIRSIRSINIRQLDLTYIKYWSINF